MKITKLIVGTVLAAAALAGAASAQQGPGRGPVDRGWVAYHYNQEFEPRTLVATAGLNCDGTMSHYPLVYGQHVEYHEFDC